MTHLPGVSGKEAVRRFEKAGWAQARTRGSHVMMRKPGAVATLSIPQHSELGSGILRKLIRLAGLTVDEFLGL